MKRILILLMFLFTFLVPLIGTQKASADTRTYPLTGDTYVNSASPTTNFSTNATMLAQGGTTVKISFVTFVIPDCNTGPIDAIRLFIYNNTPGSGTLELRQTEPFSESVLTYNAQPAVWSDVLSTNNAATAGWLVFTIPVPNMMGCEGYFSITNTGAQTQLLTRQSTQTTRHPYVEADFSETPTNTPIPPTPTNTSVPPTNTPTNTAVPPTATNTNTPIPPTNTPTNTPLPPTATPSGEPTLVTLPFVGDAHVRSTQQNTNFGTNVELWAEGSGSPLFETYIAVQNYSVPTGSTIGYVKLKMFVTSPGTGDVGARVTSTFAESTIKWNNKPAYGAVIANNLATHPVGTWVSWDVTTQYLNGDRFFVITSTGGTPTKYASKEATNAANRPYLEIQVIGTPVPTNTPLPPTNSPTNTATNTPTNTNTPVPPTNTPTNTAVPPTDTPLPPTATNTPVDTATNTPIPPTATPTFTSTPTPTATNTPTNTPLPTATFTPTPTATPTGGSNVSLPARAFFYYGWFAESWNQMGVNPWTRYQPTLGYYDSGDPTVAAAHVSEMLYAKGEVAIASWWGSDHWTDDHLPTLLNAARPTNLKIAFYYEEEGFGNKTPTQIQTDFNYLQTTYGSDSATAKIDGRIVIFVYNADDTTCEVVDRITANNTINAYLVMKVFPNYGSCANQPDAWHQYGPASREQNFAADGSFGISPGFWRLDEANPRLTRDPNIFDDNVRNMIASGADWQLIQTYNEWGEGSGVESTTGTNGFGNTYLDILAQDGQGGVPTPTNTPIPTNTPLPTNTPTAGPTPTPTPIGGSVVFGAAGDISCASNSGTCAAHRTATGNMVAGSNTDAVLLLGDTQYESGTTTEFNTYYHNSTWGRGNANDVYEKSYPVPGNHEYNVSGAPGYYAYFSDKPFAASPGYWSQVIEGVHVIGVNSETNHASGSAQYNFVQAALVANPNKCTVLIDHRPRYSSSSTHGSFTSMDAIWDLAVLNGGDIYVSGHTHMYERFGPQGTSNNAQADGMTQYISGAGGRGNFYAFGTPLPNSLVRIANESGVLFITFNGMSYTTQFIDVDGNVLDTSGGTCD